MLFLLAVHPQVLTMKVSMVSAQEMHHEMPSDYHNVVIVHATLMGAAFVLFMPLGVFTIRLTPFKGVIWAHAGIQAFAYTVALAGFGLGAWMATVSEQWRAFNGHPIIGTLVIGLLLLQPSLGYIHHKIYVEHHRRTLWIYGHIWYGRALIALAVINGGLGLQLSENTSKGEIAYGVIAGIMFLLYLAVLAISYLRKDKRPIGETGEKMIGGPKSEKSDEETISPHNGQQRGKQGHVTKPSNGGSAIAAANGKGTTHSNSGKVDDLLDGGRRELASQNAGPHVSSTADKLDPKVDSDGDKRPRTGRSNIEHATAGYDRPTSPLSVRNI